MIGDVLKSYLKKIPEHKIRLVLGILCAVALFVFSRLLIGGDLKRTLICAALSIGTGLFILLPEWDERLNIPLILLYFFYVPLKLFQRMELPFHDMSELMEGVQDITLWLILCVYLLLFLVTQRVHLALGIGNILFIVFFLIEYYVTRFCGRAFMPNDILAARTAALVAWNYDFSFYGEGAYTLLYYIFFTAWGFRMKKKGGLVFHAVISAAALASIVSFFFVTMKTDYLEKRQIYGYYWNLTDNQRFDGNLLSFYVIWKEGRMEVPMDYSVKKVEEIAGSLQEEASDGDIKPDIIMIMNEAWSDLRILGEIKTDEPFMPFTDSLEENTIRGNLHVSVLGGLTVKTEFEALTGDSLTLLAPTTIPYQNQVNHDIYALPRILSGKGYQTMAMHSGASVAWNRDEAYPYFGFEEFVSGNEFETPPEHLRDFVSDHSNYQEIIWRYENRNREKPFFLFNVTIQNHGDYGGGIDMPISVESLNGISAEEAGDLYDVETYLNLIKISDDAFRELIDYFAQAERPVIVCMFGDHQPLLSDHFYELMSGDGSLPELEQNMLSYITPYVIWANYDIEEKDYGDISANYLPGILMETAGLSLPPYYRFTEMVRSELPVLTLTGCMDADGKAYLPDDIKDYEIMQEYQIMQYNQLYDKNAVSWVYGSEGDK